MTENVTHRGTAALGAGPSTAGSTPAHAPEVSAARVRRWGAFYYAEKVLRAMRSYVWTIVLYSLGQPAAYLFAMGVGLATLVDANSTNAFGGVSYIVFIAPALLVSAAVMTASGEFTYPVMDGFKWRRVYYGPHATPITPQQIAAGHIMAIAVRFAVQSVLYLLVMMLFGATPSAWSWVLVPIAILTGLSFGVPLLAYAASVREDKGQFPMVMRFIVTPLFLFSGTFFPLDNLPLGVRWIGWISPIWHGTELGRGVSYGYQEPLWLIAVHLVFLLVLVIGGWHLAKKQFVRRLGQ